MLDHLKKPLARTYDQYEMEDEKRAWFLKWEREIARLALKAGVADALGVSRAQYTSIESGRCLATFDQVCSLAVALDVPLSILLGPVEEVLRGS